MKSVLVLATLVLCQTVVEAQSSGYTMWFLPGAAIKTFESTMVLPDVPTTGTGFHAIWPGLQPSDGSFVYQNVADDAQPGAWGWSTWYGPYNAAGDYHEYPVTPVQPADVTTSSIILDESSLEWTNTWTLEPGTAGTNAGETPTNGDTTDTFTSTQDNVTLTQALFVIELQGGAAWGFGQLAFKDITIIADTTDTAWCSSPLISTTFTHTLSGPVATIIGSQCQCTIESLIFVSPPAASDALIENAFNGTVLYRPTKYT